MPTPREIDWFLRSDMAEFFTFGSPRTAGRFGGARIELSRDFADSSSRHRGKAVGPVRDDRSLSGERPVSISARDGILYMARNASRRGMRTGGRANEQESATARAVQPPFDPARLATGMP